MHTYVRKQYKKHFSKLENAQYSMMHYITDSYTHTNARPSTSQAPKGWPSTLDPPQQRATFPHPPNQTPPHLFSEFRYHHTLFSDTPSLTPKSIGRSSPSVSVRYTTPLHSSKLCYKLPSSPTQAELVDFLYCTKHT